MNRMIRRRTGLLLALLVAVLGYVSIESRKGGAPAAERLLLYALEVPVEAIASLGSRVATTVHETFRREQLHQRISELDARIAELELERATLEDTVREHGRLADLLELRMRTSLGSRAARVIAGDASGALRSIVLDAGRRDGVERDAAVLSSDGLVGRVLKVGEQSAVVQLLSDGSSGMGALIARSRVQGVLVGSARGDCRLKYVPNQEDVRPGDRVLASGLDGIYPKGVLAGVVSEVRVGDDVFQDIRVTLSVPLARLETVLVLVGPGAPPASSLRDGLAEALSERVTVGAVR